MSSVLTANEHDQVARGIKDGLSAYFPLKSDDGRLRLELEDVFIDQANDPGQAPGFINERRYEGRDYSLPVKGRFTLYVDEKPVNSSTLQLGPYFPIIESLGTRLIQGKLYQNKYQVRRRPGVYPFRNSKGQPLIEFNSAIGGSFNFVVDAKGRGLRTFDLLITGGGRKEVTRGVYVLLRMFGASDDEIRQAWGNDLFEINSRKVEKPGEEGPRINLEQEARRIYKALMPSRLASDTSGSFEEISRRLVEYLQSGNAFDARVPRDTIGVSSSKYTKAMLLEASKKLVRIYAGKEEPGHRFSEKYRSVHGIPTQLREGLILDRKVKQAFLGRVKRNLNRAAKNPTADLKVSDMLAPARGMLSDKIRSIYTTSELSSTTETNNILDIDNRSREITIKGPGGIRSHHAIQPETIELHPSRLGLMDVVKTQVASPGVTMPLAGGAVPSSTGEIDRLLYDRKLGKVRTVTSEEADEGGVGFTDDFKKVTKSGKVTYQPKTPQIFAAKGDRVRRMPQSEVRYVLVDMSHMFSDGTNIIPFINNNSGPRVIMGANQMSQAISLSEPEAPLVDAVDEAGETFTRRIGARYNVKARTSGTVSRITRDGIYVKNAAGEEVSHALLRNFALNQGGFLDHEPIVAVGQEVKEGQLLTKNNYTTDDGRLAIGRNLFTAFMPWRGYNFEDGIVISESAAKKMGSRHVIEKVYKAEEGHKTGIDAYHGYLRDRGRTIDAENRAKLDADGVVQKGAIVQEGDVLLPVVAPPNRRNDPDIVEATEKMFGDLGLNARDKSLYWDKPYEGEVVEVRKSPTVTRIFIKTDEPFREGDKFSGRFGQKGIVSKIVPDEEMPKTEGGRTVEVLLDPHGIPNRTNFGQLYELAAGKISEKRGVPYLVKNFEEDYLEKLTRELDEEGLSDKEDLILPGGRRVPQVATGPMYLAKLKHQLDKKFSVRGMNDPYDMDEQPAGGAAMDNLTIHALVGHNARANLSEMTRLKGTANHGYWSNLANGLNPPRVAEVPFTMRKFEAMMKSLGVNVKRNRNDELELLPLTDRDVDKMSAGEITESRRFESYRVGGINPFNQGLFDADLVGPKGKNWNHVNLGEAVPNPLFTKAIQLAFRHGVENATLIRKDGSERPLSRLAEDDVERVYLGEAKVRIGEEEFSGPDGLQAVLSRVDLDRMQEDAESRLKRDLAKKNFDPSKVNNYHAALRFAANLKKHEIRPEEAFMIRKLPVMPAEFRRPLIARDGMMHTPSVNTLYAHTIASAKDLKELKEEGYEEAGSDLVTDSRKTLYQAVGALLGSGARPTGDFEGQGIIDEMLSPRRIAGEKMFGGEDSEGAGPKDSFVQRKVVKKKQDLSGRSTIVPSGTVPMTATDALDIDEIGLPEEMAWTIYEPFVREKLSKELGAVRAAEAYADRNKRARQMLLKEMERRPVLYNRAPSWWPYNVMAAKPVLIEQKEGDDKEKAIRIPNLVVGPYLGGDFDGDALSIHLPSEEEAVREAWQMTPSKHLFAPGSRNLMIVPTQSQLLGLHYLTKVDRRKPLGTANAATPKQLVGLYHKDEVEVGRKYSVGGDIWTPGWAIIEESIREATGRQHGVKEVFEAIQEEYPDEPMPDIESFTFDKTKINKRFLPALVKRFPDKYARIVQNLARAGDNHATNIGFTLGLSDIQPQRDLVKKEMERVEKEVPRLAKEIASKKNRKVTEGDVREARVQLYINNSEKGVPVGTKLVKSVQRSLEDQLKKIDVASGLLDMMRIGSKGNETQIRQGLGAVLMVSDVHKDVIDEPIEHGYGEGLRGGEYYLQQHGALAGLRDRAVETSKPGDIGKQIVAGSTDLVVSVSDCGTQNGVEIAIKDADGKIRTKDLNGRYLAGGRTEVTGEVLSRLIREGKTKVKVRSPLTCEAKEGVCALCFGEKEDGQLPSIGENVGVREGQAIVEASTKLTLKAFHTSGSADSGPSFDRFEEVIQLRSPNWKAIVIKAPKGATVEITDIKEVQTPGGKLGFDVFYRVEGTQKTRSVHVPPGKQLRSEVRQAYASGARMKAGDPLTEGFFDPNEMMETNGFEAARDYVTDELHNIFSQIGGIGRRTAETTVAAMSRMGRVVDPGDSSFFAGDHVPVGQASAFNREATEQRIVQDLDLEGRELAEAVVTPSGHRIEAGKKLSAQDVLLLKREMPRGTVNLKRRPVDLRLELTPMKKVPRLGDNWMAQMNFRNLKSQLTGAAIRGAKAPIHGTNPISAYMYGAEMDRGEDEKRWKY